MSGAVHVRPVVPSDDTAVLEIVLARDVADLGEPDYTLEDLHADWARDDVSVWLAELGGEPVGVGVVDPGGAYVAVHPAHEGRGVGSALRVTVEEGERAICNAELVQNVSERNEPAKALLTEAGYALDGFIWRMSIDLAGAPAPPAENPVRAYDADGDDPTAIHALIEEAFTEIEGNTPTSFETWRTWVLDREDPDFELYGVIEEDGRAVAALIGTAAESVGFIHQLAVERAARGRGHGRALLTTAFDRFGRRGLKTSSLYVVGSNESALRLYESVGMRQIVALGRWKRPLD